MWRGIRIPAWYLRLVALLASGEQGSGLGPGAAVADRTQESRSLEVFLGDLQTLWQSSQPRRRKART